MEKAKLIADVEDDSFNGIVIEGIARVIADRSEDPTFLANIQKQAEAKKRKIDEDLAKITALLMPDKAAD